MSTRKRTETTAGFPAKLHGEKDDRVPVTQGLECYGVLQAKGIPARRLHFPDENHWLLKPHNSIRWYGEVLDWMGRWLEG